MTVETVNSEEKPRSTYRTIECVSCNGHGYWKSEKSTMTCRECGGEGKLIEFTGKPDIKYLTSKTLVAREAK